MLRVRWAASGCAVLRVRWAAPFAPLIHLGGGSALIGELLDGLLGCVAFVINLGHFLFGLLLREQLRSSVAASRSSSRV